MGYAHGVHVDMDSYIPWLPSTKPEWTQLVEGAGRGSC